MNNAAPGGRRPVLDMFFSRVIQAPVPAFLTCNNEEEIYARLTGFVSVKLDGVCQMPGAQVYKSVDVS